MDYNNCIIAILLLYVLHDKTFRALLNIKKRVTVYFNVSFSLKNILINVIEMEIMLIHENKNQYSSQSTQFLEQIYFIT